MAKAGGILTFCMIGAVVLGLLLMLAAQQAPVVAIISGLLFLVAFVLWFVVMIALKVDLDQNDYRRAGGLIWAIITLTVLFFVLAIVAGVVVGSEFASAGDPSSMDPTVMMRALGPWGIVLGIASLVLTICFLVLGVRLSEYAAIGGGVWKGAGIVLIIASALGLFNFFLYLMAFLTSAGAFGVVAMVLGFIGLILWAVVWILIGIGFMSDANRMAAAGVRR